MCSDNFYSSFFYFNDKLATAFNCVNKSSMKRTKAGYYIGILASLKCGPVKHDEKVFIIALLLLKPQKRFSPALIEELF